jgi:pyruvate/2-oxoglutarate dehydrogenase complex dihydrolipoamide dehydrogenase (E3) component
VRVYYRGGSAKIAGATIVADHAGDIIGELVLAMNTGTGLARLSSVIHPYPTQAEMIKHLGDAFMRTKATPSLLKLLRHFFRWRR